MADMYTTVTFNVYIPEACITPDELEVLSEFNYAHYLDPERGYYFYSDDPLTSCAIPKALAAKVYLAVPPDEYEGVDVEEEHLHEMLRRILARGGAGCPKYICIEAALTCSKMLMGEFGGFAVFITAEKVEYLSTSLWLTAKVGEIEAAEEVANAG